MADRQALYRRYRPQTFGEVVGQESVTRTLRNAIAHSQVAHAYLLAGPRGIGKTSIARLIAKALNCPKAKDGEPCDACASCVSIREGRYLDLIEIDAASNRGIDEMRDLRDKVRFAPSEGQYKVYVIDEAHQLTSEAFNALLKTLEEPPGHVVFVLATTEAQRIPATIVSRTQRFDLRRIPHKGVVRQLAAIAQHEKWKVEPAALEAIARHAQGGLRDAESTLDQLAAFTGGTIGAADVEDLLGASDWEDTAALFDALAADDAGKAVTLVGSLVDDGRDLRLFVRRAIDHVRALVLARATGGVPEGVSEGVAAKIAEQAPKFSLEKLARIARRLIETEQYLRQGDGTPLPLEIAILELTTASAPAPDPGARASAAATSVERAGSGSATRPGSGPAPRPVPGAAASPSGATAPVAARPAMAAASAGSPSRTGRPAGLVDLAARRTAANGPAAERAPAGGTGVPHTLVTLDRVRHAWSALVERTKELSVGKAAQLADAEPLAMEGTVVVIGFADEFARLLWQDKRRPELEEQLSTLVGASVRVRCVKQQAPAGATPALEDPMLRAALETFRRPDRILEVE